MEFSWSTYDYNDCILSVNGHLHFTFDDSFVLPEDPWGEQGPSLSSLLLSRRNTNGLSFVQELIQGYLEKWEKYSDISEDQPEFSPTNEPGNKSLPMVIIDGGNVAMSHGLDVFFSCPGICLAVKHFWNKGYRDIIVCVANWRMNSINTIYGHEHLQDLERRGFVCRTPSLAYDDRIILNEAKARNALIVTNDRFREFNQDWKDTKERCVRFEFDGNTFKAFMLSTEAASRSSVQPTDT